MKKRYNKPIKMGTGICGDCYKESKRNELSIHNHRKEENINKNENRTNNDHIQNNFNYVEYNNNVRYDKYGKNGKTNDFNKFNYSEKKTNESSNNSKISNNNKSSNKNQNKINTYLYKEEDKGLKNIGNSCYINSFLQIIFHTPTFINILKYYFKSGIKTDLIDSLIQLSENPNKINLVYNIKKEMSKISPDYNTNKQNDTQEFGIYLIDEINNQIKNESSLNSSYDWGICRTQNVITFKKQEYNKFLEFFCNNETEIDDLFKLIESESIINYNNLENVKFNCCYESRLSFPINNYSNNKIFSIYELLENKYCYGYEYIKNQNGRKSQRTLLRKICKLPKILIFTISRCKLNESKNNSTLKFCDKLDISEYIDKDLVSKSECTQYKLFAINKNIGKTNEFGHCFCYIFVDNVWYEYNDENVFQRTPYFSSESVVGLFYKRKDCF